jgi:hypothetical protein
MDESPPSESSDQPSLPPVPDRRDVAPARRAARLCFVLTFVGWVLGATVISFVDESAEGRPRIGYAFLLVPASLWIAAIVYGVKVRRQMRPDTQRAALLRLLAMAAMVVNGIFAFFAAITAGAAVVVLMMWHNLDENIANGEYQQQKAKLGDGASLDGKLAESAQHVFSRRRGEILKEWTDSIMIMTNPVVLDVRSVTSQAELQARQQTTREFIETCRKVRTFFEQSSDLFQAELQRHKMSEAKRQAEYQNFQKTWGAVNAKNIELTTAQVQKGEITLKALRLLDASWGRWQYVKQSNQLTFADANNLAEYRQIIAEEIKQEKEILRLSKELAALSTPAPEAR